MTRVPRISGKSVCEALLRGGFRLVSVKGSHHFLKRQDGTGGLVTVPVHGSRDILHPTTLGSILTQAGISVDEFIDLL